jgi:hypothetical protein
MVLYAVTPPVVDYERMRRVYPQPPGKITINFYTGVCIFFIVVGVLVLIKRYKDKQIYGRI